MPYTPKEAKCPLCGHSAGIYQQPRDERTPETPIRCLACREETPAREWFENNPDKS
jgi:hypothetical protein